MSEVPLNSQVKSPGIQSVNCSATERPGAQHILARMDSDRADLGVMKQRP